MKPHSVPENNFGNFVLLNVYKTTCKHDFLSETCLGSSITYEENSFVLKSYKLICCRSPCYVNRCDEFVYFQESFSVCVIDISFLDEASVRIVLAQQKSVSISDSRFS